MNEEFTSNESINDDTNHDIDKFEIENLITRLKEIKTTIALLEKTVFK